MPNRLFDSAGRPVDLGREIGRGGEGAVWETTQPGQAAKVYTKVIDATTADKLIALPGTARPELLKVAAWPTATVHAVAGGPAVGVLMPLVRGHVELHQLYSSAHRRRHFPDRDWGFLVHVAMNLAAAVETVHDAGHVIGDLNQRGVLVNPQGTVHLIDCDSFQLRSPSRLFRCEVGVAEFTPPELQGVNFRTLDRTPAHDCFGLAVLVFQLLFVGFHPYRGRYGGAGDLTIERAIAEGRFAFGRGAASQQMRPPPAAPEIGLVPNDVASLFEAAFAPTNGPPGRPTAAQWRLAMAGLTRRLARCRVDASHVYPTARPACAWCAIETAGGVAFFTSGTASPDFDDGFDLPAAWDRIAAVRRPPAAAAFKMPRPPGNRVPTPMPADTDWQSLGPPVPVPRPSVSPLRPIPEMPGPFVPEVVPDDPVFVADLVPTVPVMPPEDFVAAVDAAYRRPRSRLLRLLFPGSYEYQAARQAAEEQSREHQQHWHDLIAETTRERERALTHNAKRRAALEAKWARLRERRAGLDERNARYYAEWQAKTRRTAAEREANATANAAVAERWDRESRAYEAAKRAADAYNGRIAAAKAARDTEVRRRRQHFEALAEAMTALPRTWAAEAAASHREYEDALTRLRSARAEYEALHAAFDARKAGLEQGRQAAQLRDHLHRALIDDAVIPGVGPTRKAKLAAYGIETALDALTNDVSAVPDFGTKRTAAVRAWVADIERRFVFDPRQGVPAGELRSLHTAFHARRVALRRELTAGVDGLDAFVGRAERRLAELEAVADGRIDELTQAWADASVD